MYSSVDFTVVGGIKGFCECLKESENEVRIYEAEFFSFKISKWEIALSIAVKDPTIKFIFLRSVYIKFIFLHTNGFGLHSENDKKFTITIICVELSPVDSTENLVILKMEILFSLYSRLY